MRNTNTRSGLERVDVATGEVFSVEPFNIRNYLSTTLSEESIKHQKDLAAAYDKACAALIGPNDVQQEGGRTFKKKSAWRKLARYFGISTSVISTEKEIIGEYIVASVTVCAQSPWGQHAEAVGACSTDEEVGRRRITIADAIATAETRATNRAVSSLIAMGEESAEERSKSNAKRNATGGKTMPIGKNKGKLLADISSTELQGAIDWCKEKGQERFAELINDCQSVINGRSMSENTESDPHTDNK